MTTDVHRDSLRENMNGKENPIELLVICAAMVVLSLLGLIGGLSRRIFGTLDGLLMLAVCGMTALIFAGLSLVLAKERGWLGKRRKGDGDAPPAAAAGK
jgi:hypothetical protein